MDRLNFDVYKRQAKPNRIKEMISEQKVKIKEQSRVIDDLRLELTY